MNYRESAIILEKIKSSNKVLLSCHHHPDSDTVGAATVLSETLKDLGKETKIICPDIVPPFLQFIKGAKDISHENLEDFDFSNWDLFIVCDTSNWDRLFINKHNVRPKTPVVVIDNHTSNQGFGDINLLDYETSSVCEMIFDILSDWKINITPDMATALFSGMAGDTGSFRFEVFENTFEIAGNLIKKGADVHTVNYNLFDTKPLKLMKFLGVVVDNISIDPAGFCYSAINYDKYKEFSDLYATREVAATEIIARIENTKFGFIMTEESPKSISISFRSRTGVDTAKIAVSLGGGGHPSASGAWIQGKNFEETLNEVITKCREAANLQL